MATIWIFETVGVGMDSVDHFLDLQRLQTFLRPTYDTIFRPYYIFLFTLSQKYFSKYFALCRRRLIDTHSGSVTIVFPSLFTTIIYIHNLYAFRWPLI